jgi:hypothetical protein
MVDVGNKGNKKTKVHLFLHPGNSKKFRMVHVEKCSNFLYLMVKTFDWDKFNPAYMSEVKGTTGKGGEDDKGVQFTRAIVFLSFMKARFNRWFKYILK